MNANANAVDVQQLAQINKDKMTLTLSNGKLLQAHLDVMTGDAVPAPPARPTASDLAIIADFRRLIAEEATLTARLAQPTLQVVPPAPQRDAASLAAVQACTAAAAEATKAIQELAAKASRKSVARTFPGEHHNFSGDPSTKDQHEHARGVFENFCATEDVLNGLSPVILDNLRSNDNSELSKIAEACDEIRKISETGKSAERALAELLFTANTHGWPVAHLAHGSGGSRDADLTKRIKESTDTIAKQKEEKSKTEKAKKNDDKDNRDNRYDRYERDNYRDRRENNRDTPYRKDNRDNGGGGGGGWYNRGNRR